MTNHLYKLFFLTLSLALIFPAKQESVRISLNSKVLSRQNSNLHPSKSFPRLSNDNLDDIIIWSEDFVDGAANWLIGDGWELTQGSYHSPNNSILSPNDNNNMDGYFMLLSPKIPLPQIGLNEWLYFTFWLHADIPDYDSDEDGFIDDYYQLDIQVPSDSSAWHISDFESFSGNSYWCGIETDAGYHNGWLQFLDTPSIQVPSDGGSLKAKMKWAIEDTTQIAGAIVSEGWIDGWDAANVRISVDGGTTWSILIADNIPYDFYSGYGWLYNGEKAGEHGTHSLASGWNEIVDWQEVIFNLNDYAGQNVIIRFAFGSDPGWSTADEARLKGFFIDDIIIKDNLNNSIASYNADDGDFNLLNSSGYIWQDLFYDHYFDFCIDEELIILEQYPTRELCETNNYLWYSRPGSSGWEEYLPGDPFCDNCNYFLDLTEYAGKDVVMRFWARYDNDHDKQGNGLYIDDLNIYKESIQIYAQPQLFNAEATDDAVLLTWYDMNQSGDSTIIFDSGDESLFLGIRLDECTDCLAFAGTLFPAWMGQTTVESISIYNINESAVDVTVNAYGLINNEPAQSIDISLSETSEWNTFDVAWDFPSLFIIAYSFSDEIAAAYDPSTNMAGLWFLSNDVGSWEYVFYDGSEIAGNWGTRAQVSFDGLDVTYNLYRDSTLIQTGLTIGAYTDTNFEYNTDYYYHLGAVYSDGIEIFTSDSIAITTPLPPIPEGVLELSYDDDNFEGEFNAGKDNYNAVQFSPDSESQFLYMIEWFQIGSGGAFYIKVWDNAELFDDDGVDGELNTNDQGEGNGVYDVGEVFTDSNDNGVWDPNIDLPGNEIYSKTQASGNENGWNQKVLASEIISISGSFWVGAKEFSSSQPFGLDSTSISGFSYQREGENGEWLPIEGNLAIRAYLSNEPLSITNSEIPFNYGIKDIFPNPFNPVANIQFEVAEFSQVKLSIIDLNGRLVSVLGNGKMNPGQYQSLWDGVDNYGNQVSSGIYLAVLESNGMLIQTRKLVLLK